ncbi:hypothetical protein P8452_26504 [Trifolium repens]|nr:hypothetical protein P8452_26504 [Trifolium repens]
MSQPSTQTSPTKTSPQKSSPTTTTTSNAMDDPTGHLPQPSETITNAVPLTVIHSSFASVLNPPKITTSNSSPSPKPKNTKRTKSAIAKKPKSQRSKSRYSSNFDMQKLYLEDQGNASTNVAPDVTTPCPDAQIETNKQVNPPTLSEEKGDSPLLTEKGVPNTPIDQGVDEETQNIKIVEDVLNSLVDSVSSDKDVPDAPASLAQDKPQDEMAEDVVADSPVEQEKDVAADSSVQQEKDVAPNLNTDNAMSVEDNVDYVTADEDVEVEDDHEDEDTEDDVTIMKIVGDSNRKGGKTGVSSRLRARKGKMTEVVAGQSKSTKKKGVAAEATKSPKKKKVAAEATKSAKKKMYGPSRRSSRVEMPAKQKKQGSKRKTIDLSESEHDAEEDAPIITTSSKQKTPKKRKTTVATSVADAEENAPSIVSAKKKVAGRTIPPNIPDVPMDNVSFHFSASAAKWKFVYHRRLALERELSDEALECQEVMNLIQKAGLMKTVCGLGKCYEKLVKEFTVNIGEDCDNRLSKEFHQVFVRGKCVEFSPAVINRFLGRREDDFSELEPTINQVCKTITAN